MGAQWYDANISLPGCDKNMPGTIIAMARLNRPSLMIYGGALQGRGGPMRCRAGGWGVDWDVPASGSRGSAARACGHVHA